MTETCPQCGGSGFRLTTRDDGVLSSARCECELEDRGTKRLRVARIPKRYAHCSFDEFYPLDASLERALRLAREWIADWPQVQHGLMFLGHPGAGKTHLAVAIARELIRGKGAQLLFYEQRELLKALQGTFDSGSEQRESEVLAPVLAAEVLVLDDLGAGRTTPWARDVMHDIIAHRYNEEKLMIITSNHATGDEPEKGRGKGDQQLDRPLSLRDRLGDALMSRIYEMCRIVKMRGRDGEDYRRKMQTPEITR